MKIVVLVKQVPDSTEIRVDKETGTLIRAGVPSIINPDDLAGVEEALKLKESTGATVTIVSMGPPQATEMLKELYARGVDECVLITDRKFAGADTCATSSTLVLTTLSGMNTPRYMNCNDIVDSMEKEVTIWTFDDLGIDESKVGLAGSPTKVHHTFTKDVSAETETFTLPADEAAKLIAKTLKEKQLITK